MDKKTLTQASITRFPSPVVASQKTKEEKTEAIAHHVRSIMEILGLDLSHHSLQKTPERVAHMYVHEIFSGLDPATFPSTPMFEDEGLSNMGNMVVTKVDIVSFCEHHLVPMIGTAFVGYMPKDKVIGLSKISRIARYFASRPQLQERLSAQIGDSIATILGHRDIIVLLKAQHTCVIARGVKAENSQTTTLYTDGLFESSAEYRREFFTITADL